MEHIMDRIICKEVNFSVPIQCMLHQIDINIKYMMMTLENPKIAAKEYVSTKNKYPKSLLIFYSEHSLPSDLISHNIVRFLIKPIDALKNMDIFKMIRREMETNPPLCTTLYFVSMISSINLLHLTAVSRDSKNSEFFKLCDYYLNNDIKKN
jgi:hypothetical protein